MAEQGIEPVNLGTARARAEFRRAHYDFLYQAAIGVSGSREMAEKLTEKLFSMMEANFEEKELPYGVELYMLSRLHRLYAEEGPIQNPPTAMEKAADAPQVVAEKHPQVAEVQASQAVAEKHSQVAEVQALQAVAEKHPQVAEVQASQAVAEQASQAAEVQASQAVAEKHPQVAEVQASQVVAEKHPQVAEVQAPQAVAEKHPQAAEGQASQAVAEQASQAAEREAKPIPTTGGEASPADKREHVSHSVPAPRRRRAQDRSIPVQSAARDIPIADAVPSEMVRPMMIRLPGGTQTYYAPQSFLVQPLYPTEGAPATAAQSAQTETQGSKPSELSPSETVSAAPTEASYDPSLTEFWLPRAEKNGANQPTPPASKAVAPVAEAAAPVAKPVASAPKPAAPAAKPAPSPTSRTSEEAREQEEQRMRRSMPLTIVNTFLFLGLLTAIAYLLMELGLLPKLF